MKKAIFFLALISILFSCKKGPRPQKSEFYICGYYDIIGSPDKALVYYPDATNHEKHKIEYSIFPYEEANKGRNRIYYSDKSHYKDLTPAELISKEKFDSLNRKYNVPLPYNKRVVRYDPIAHTLWAKRIISIDVTSDQDFDETHSAGTSLNDIMIFDTWNNLYYIRSEYKDESLEQKRILKKLDEVTLDEMTLISSRIWTALFRLSFTHSPTKNNIEDITLNIAIKTDDGGVYPVQKPIP